MVIFDLPIDKEYKALLYDSLEEYEEVINALTEYIKSNPTGIAYNNRGVAYWEIGKNKEAILNFEKALKLLPNNKTIIFNLKSIREKKA